MTSRPLDPDNPDGHADHSVGMKPRLMGMETEYAVIVADAQDLDADDLPPAGMVYSQIVEAIRRTQPAAPGVYDRDQWFLASGPAVTFESHPSLWHLPGGLIELATPEVHRAKDLVECQHAIDELVAAAAADSETGYDLRVLKNSSDALGHLYGCQENYQCDVASGITMVFYRFFMVGLMLLQLCSQLLSLPFLAAVIGFSVLRNRRSKPTDDIDDLEFSGGELGVDQAPPSHIRLMTIALRSLHWPMVLGLKFVAKHFAFRPAQKYLTAHLVSRVVLCGGGHLDHDGRYALSPKSLAIDRLADMGGYNGERPVFVFGHWLSMLCAKSFFSPRAMASLLGKRQRMQIGLSDSNLSDAATLVKIGSVALILDMIEAGATSEFPRVKSPVAAANQFGADWNLVRSVPTDRGDASALDIQHRYLVAVERYAQTLSGDQREDADEILFHWRRLWELASDYRRNATHTDDAMGRIDWLTKRVLIESLGDDAVWAERKKIDLRFHELSPDGYYHRLLDRDPSLSLVDADTVQTRHRAPPPGTRAIRRGAWIREFAADGSDAKADWSHGSTGKTIQKF